MTPAISPEEQARRAAANRRVGWALAALAVIVFFVFFFSKI